MVMLTDKDGSVDRNDDSKSPWRKPPINTKSPVLGAAASWPALSEARDAPPIPPPPATISHKQPPSSDSKGSNGQPSSNGSAHRNNPHNRHQKSGYKRGGPQTHAPFNEPRLPHPRAPMMPPMPMPIPVPVPFQYPPGPFPPVIPQGGGKTQMKPFGPPLPVPVQPTSPGDANSRGPVRTPFVQDPAFPPPPPPHMWRNQRPVYPVGPQGFVRPFFGQPGFMVGPRIPGNTDDI